MDPEGNREPKAGLPDALKIARTSAYIKDQDVFQETVNGLQRSPKPGVGGSTGLTPQSPPRSPSPNPRSSSPKKQPKTMSHTGIIPLASHLVTARRVHRHLNKSLTLS